MTKPSPTYLSYMMTLGRHGILHLIRKMALAKNMTKIPCPHSTSTHNLLCFLTHPHLAYLGKKPIKMVPLLTPHKVGDEGKR